MKSLKSRRWQAIVLACVFCALSSGCKLFPNWKSDGQRQPIHGLRMFGSEEETGSHPSKTMTDFMRQPRVGSQDARDSQ
ncbi:MAG: hypothetical protein HQ581_20560 [Planctomycetes bacterium]|nr:hypothetical protein [Planctomycetota bacterium]